MARVLIADRFRVVAEGIAALLRADPGFEEVRAVTTVDAVREEARTFKPDIVVSDVDLGSGSGFDVARYLRHRRPRPRLIFLSEFVNPEFVLGAFAAGAAGYLVKDDPGEALVEALHRIMRGDRVYSREVRRVAAAMGQPRGTDARASDEVLSGRERDVILCIAQGATFGEVGEKLGIQPSTVRTLCNRAQEKLGLRTLPQRRLGVVRRRRRR